MTTPTTPEAARAEQERVLALLEGITPGEWESGHESAWALGDSGTNRFYALIQPGFDGGKRTPDAELDRNAALIAAAPTLARDHAALLGAYAEALARERWIPVSERLPEEGVEVLGYFPLWACNKVAIVKRYYRACTDSYEWHFIAERAVSEDRYAAHWRPLPPPPAQAPAGAEGGEG